jgi:hypothetical protein
LTILSDTIRVGAPQESTDEAGDVDGVSLATEGGLGMLPSAWIKEYGSDYGVDHDSDTHFPPTHTYKFDGKNGSEAAPLATHDSKIHRERVTGHY